MTPTFLPKSLKKVTPRIEKAELKLPVVDFIRRKWTVSFNIFTRTVNIINKETKLSEDFIDVYLHIYHVGGFKISKTYLIDLFESCMFPKIHPVRQYFDALPAKYKHTSHIDMLCDYITARDFHTGINYQERFKTYFKRWLVAAVANAYGLKHNEMALIFIHKVTGSGKTHLTRKALCENISDLKGFVKQNPDISDREKFLRIMAQNFFIVLDEFGKLNERQLNFYKDVISESQLVTKLRSGDRMNTITDRLANFIGSTNETSLFTNKTQLRKFLCIEVERIDKSYSDVVDFNQVWAEAVLLVKTEAYKTMGWNDADFRENEEYNLRYTRQTDATYYVSECFRPCKRGDGEFLTASEVSEYILTHFDVEDKHRAKLNSGVIGEALNELGFERWGKWIPDRKSSKYGYSVIITENQIEKLSI
jgi:hypothetical protein